MKWVLIAVALLSAGCATRRTVWIYADDLEAIRKQVTDAGVVRYGFTPGKPDTVTVSIPKHQRKVITKADSPVRIDNVVVDVQTGEVLRRETEEFLLH